MITIDQITEIGRFNQPHGIKGEINAVVFDGVDLAELSCVVLDIEGIYVPFFMSGLRQRGVNSYLVTIEGIENELKAASIANKVIYALRDEIADNDNENGEEGYYADDFIGFQIKSTDKALNGIVSDIDDSTDNVLFVVTAENGKTHLIPVADEMIVEIDADDKSIVVELPIGLLDL